MESVIDEMDTIMSRLLQYSAELYTYVDRPLTDEASDKLAEAIILVSQLDATMDEFLCS